MQSFKHIIRASVIIALFVTFNGLDAISAQKQRSVLKSLKIAIEKLRPLHKSISKPGPEDWLAQHPEPGQTFEQYLHCQPVTPQGKRNILYIQPIGKFSKKQTLIVRLTAEYMKRYFNLKVKTNKSIPLSAIPDSARRTHPRWGDKQILTTYVLDKLLKPRLPQNAAAMIAFTTSDLWPGGNWNFVFGQASLKERVGIWSVYRNGDLNKGMEAFRLCLKRTIKTAVHETGHMFSMRHCIAYECCMNGSNNRRESDRHPLYLCPECMAKVCWATQAAPVERFKALIDFCDRVGFKKESTFFGKSIHQLEH